MAPPKRFWARLKLSPKFLGTLPEFPAYISKSRLKKLAQEERRSGTTSMTTLQRSSPAPEGGASAIGPTISNYKVNVGLKEGSTSGLTINSITSGQYSLDKSGKPAKRWVKKPRLFKTFTGFKVTCVSFKPEHGPETKETQKTEEKEVILNTSTNGTTTPSNTPAVSLAPNNE